MENKLKTGLCLFLCCLGMLTGCRKENDYSGLFSADSNANERFEQSKQVVRQTFPALINMGSDSYIILVAADCHVGGTDNLVKLLERAKEPKVSALFLAGDVSTGKKGDYDALKKVLDRTDSVSWYIVPGNHDLFFDGWKTFFSFFGPATFTVTLVTPGGSDLFICLDTGSGTLGSKQLEWFKELLRKHRNDFRNCIVITHNNFFRKTITESTTPLTEEIYELLDLFSNFRVNLVITGHDHQRSVDKLGPTTYLTLDGFLDGLPNASYLEMEVKDGIIEYRFSDL